MIVGLCGLSGSGKDAVGKILVKAHGFIRVAFADIMKRICMEVFDFTEEQVWGEGKNTGDGRYPREHSFEWDSDGRRRCACCGIVGAQELDGKKCYLTPRYALQTLGSWGRNCYSDIWTERTLQIAKQLLKSYVANEQMLKYSRIRGLYPSNTFYIPSCRSRGGLRIQNTISGVVITDVRFKNEIAAIKKAGGKVVRILRPGYTEPKWNHPSETEQLEVPDEEFDYILHNDGTLVDLVIKLEDMSFSLEG